MKIQIGVHAERTGETENAYNILIAELQCMERCYKKFWEELIAYFPFIRHGSLRKRRL
jgi:hypothetical protein